MYRKDLILDFYGSPFVSEELDYIEHLAKEMKRFTLHIPHGHSSSYFIMTYVPHFPSYQAPSFNLKIIEGKSQDNSTWKILVDFGFCYVNLLDMIPLNDWHRRYTTVSKDILFYYDIPVGIL